MRPQNSSSPLCLLVEGQDDRHVIQHLWKKEHKKEDLPFCISDKDGIEKLIDAIPGEMKADSREILGIVIDANGNLDECWKKVTSKIKEGIKDLGIEQVQFPDGPTPTGTIIDCNHYKLRYIGIWLMPNNKECGELENFIIKMLPEGDLIWPSAQKYIEDIPEKDRKFNNSKSKKGKAQLFAWLATRKKPGRMGTAIGVSDLTLDNELSKDFLKWLSDLFKKNLKKHSH